MAQGGGVAGEYFPAAALAAFALGSGGVDNDVAEFACHAGTAAHKAAIDDDARADSFRYCDDDEVVDLGAVLAEIVFSQRAGVRGVFYFYR